MIPRPTFYSEGNVKTEFEQAFVEAINSMTNHVHATARQHGFWNTDEQANLGTKIALLHSEVSELLEAIRTEGKPMSEKLPELPLAAEELADIIIRTMDIAHYIGVQLGDAIVQKARYNTQREFRHERRF